MEQGSLFGAPVRPFLSPFVLVCWTENGGGVAGACFDLSDETGHRALRAAESGRWSLIFDTVSGHTVTRDYRLHEILCLLCHMPWPPVHVFEPTAGVGPTSVRFVVGGAIFFSFFFRFNDRYQTGSPSSYHTSATCCSHVPLSTEVRVCLFFFKNIFMIFFL